MSAPRRENPGYTYEVKFYNLNVCLVESGTSGKVRLKLYGDNSKSMNYVIPGGPVSGREDWKLFSRGGRDHFLCITEGLLDFYFGPADSKVYNIDNDDNEKIMYLISFLTSL